MTTKQGDQERADDAGRPAQHDENGKAKFQVALDKVPETSRRSKRGSRCGSSSPARAVERNLTLPIVPTATMIGVKSMFSGRSLGEGENANFDVVVASPDGKQLPATGLRYELLRIERRYQYYRRDGRWDYEPVKSVSRISTAASTWRPTGPGAFRCPSPMAATGSMYRAMIAAFRPPP